MNLFARNIDEPDDDSRIPRRFIFGTTVIGVVLVLLLVLLAVGVGLFTADWHTGPPEGYRNRWATSSRPPLTSNATNAATNAEAAAPWRVRPNAERIPPMALFQPPRPLMLSPREKLVFPAVQSPFVASGPEDTLYHFQIWNMATAELVGEIRVHRGATLPIALSPSGKHLATSAAKNGSNGIYLWSAANGQMVQGFAPDGPRGGLEFLAFIDDKHLLAVYLVGADRVAHVWRFADGTLCGRFTVGKMPGLAALAISPGGQFLAVASGNELSIHELPSGDVAGRISVSRTAGLQTLDCLGLAFSPDMTELAAFCQGQFNSRIVCWSLATGAHVVEHVFTTDWIAQATRARDPTGASIAWLADGQGWLVLDRLLIDRQSGTHLWTVPRTDQRALFVSARVVGPDRLAVVEEQKDGRRVSVIALPQRELAAARALSRSR